MSLLHMLLMLVLSTCQLVSSSDDADQIGRPYITLGLYFNADVCRYSTIGTDKPSPVQRLQLEANYSHVAKNE